MAEVNILNPDQPTTTVAAPDDDEIFYGPGGVDGGIYLRKGEDIYSFQAIKAAQDPTSPYYQSQYQWTPEGGRDVYGNTNPMLDAQENRKIYDQFLLALGSPEVNGGVKTYTADIFNALLGRGGDPTFINDLSLFQNLNPQPAGTSTIGTNIQDPLGPLSSVDATQTQPIYNPATGQWTLGGQPTTAPQAVQTGLNVPFQSFEKKSGDPTVYGILPGGQKIAFQSWEQFLQAGGTEGAIKTNDALNTAGAITYSEYLAARQTTPQDIQDGVASVPPSSNINATDLTGDTLGVDLSNTTNIPSTDTAGTVVASVIAGQKTLQDYINQLTPPQSETDKKYNDILSRYDTLLESSAGKAQATAQAQIDAGVPQLKVQLQNINNAILIKNAEYAQLVAEQEALKADQEGKPITMASIIGSQYQIDRAFAAKKGLAAAEMGLLYAQSQAMTGNIQLALELAQQAVNAKYGPIEDELRIREAQLNAILPILNKEESRYALASQLMIDDQRQALQDQKNRESEINSIMLSAAQAGADANTLSAISRSGSVQNAITAASTFYRAQTAKDEAKTLQDQIIGIMQDAANAGADTGTLAKIQGAKSVQEAIQIFATSSQATGKTAEVIKFGQDNGVTTRFYNYAGEIRNSLTGEKYGTPDAFFKAAGVTSFADAYAKGLITDIGGQSSMEWSDPYNLGGDIVQKNLKTGEIRTAVNVGGGGSGSDTGTMAVNLYSNTVDAALAEGATPQDAVLAAVAVADATGTKLNLTQQNELLKYAQNKQSQPTPQPESEPTAPAATGTGNFSDVDINTRIATLRSLDFSGTALRNQLIKEGYPTDAADAVISETAGVVEGIGNFFTGFFR